MELTAIQSSVTLFEILCVIIVFATFFMRSRFFNEVFEHHPKWTTQILLMVFFGIMSIFGTLSGLSIYGAVVNVRDLGPMAAGLLCGPYIGIGSGIIGGLFRFSQGGPYMWTGLSAPILSGILGGIMYLANKRQFVPAWTAVLLIGLSETLISCYTLILVTKPSEFFTVVTTVAIPMIVFNIIGMVIFATVVHNILDERMIQKRMQLLELEVESKRNLSTIINTISFPVYVLDLNQRFVLVNDSFCRFIGRQRDEILLKTPRDFFNEGDLLFHHNLTDEDFQNQNSRENDMTITVPDGKKYAVISTSTVFKDAPCTGFVVGVFQDITRRKQAEKKLRQTTEYLNNLFNYANAPIIVWDTEFRITRFNHAFEYITGRTEQDVLGQPLDILFPADSRDASLTLIKKTLEGEHWKTVEIPILTKDGR
ncbi:MAG: LytS/YhcK type 5TM receptor domain-containing protein, partial [Methanoregula sp.]